MNFVSRREFIFGTIFLLLILSIHRTDAIRRRRQINNGGHNDLDWEVMIADVSKIPLFGPVLSEGLQDLTIVASKIDEVTNGAVSRVAESYTPCVINVGGLECIGEGKSVSVKGIIKDIVDHTELPNFAKKMIKNVLDTVVFPTFNAILDVPGSSEKTE